MPPLSSTNALFTSVKNSIEQLLKESENQPASKVNLCGNPVAIPLLCSGAEVFDDLRDDCLRVASTMGQLVWQEGVCLTGNALFTGITGNASLLHSIFRIYKLLSIRVEDEKE